MLWHKAWVETRSRFWIGLGVLLCSSMFMVMAWPRVSRMLPEIAGAGVPGDLGQEIRDAVALSSEYPGYIWGQWFHGNLINLATLFAALLGAGGLLSARAGTLFLLSLPASRNALLFTRAATGLAELLALITIPSLLVPLLSPAVGKSYSVGDALVHSLCVFCGASIFYGLSFLLSTEFSDIWKPLLIALAAAMVLNFTEQGLRENAPLGLFRVMSGETYFDNGQVPWLGLLGSTLTAAALLYAAVLNTARRDF